MSKIDENWTAAFTTTATRERPNVHSYWVNPMASNRAGVDGALRSFVKLKRAGHDVDRKVVQETYAQEWPIDAAENSYDPSIAC